MITSTYLAKVLVRMGYSADEGSCKRRFTDWRQKGLLPPLKVKGRQHRGKVYYWDNSEVTAQAVTVFKFFKIYHRSKWVILSLWFVGYEVSPIRVREIWIKNLEAEINYFQKNIRPDEEMIDVLSRLVDSRILRKNKKEKSNMHFELFISFISNTLNNPDFDLQDLGEENDIEKSINEVLQSSSDNKNKSINPINIKTLSNFLRKHFSLTARYELIRSGSIEDLEQAHRNWRMAKPILQWMNRLLTHNPTEKYKEDLQIVRFIGLCFIMLNLILDKLGYGSKFENSLKKLCQLLLLIDAVEIRGKIQNSLSIVDDDRVVSLREHIISVWKSTSIDRLEEL